MGQNHKILVVDDDKIVRVILSDTLQTNGFSNVRLATNGAEGLAMAREEKPDLVITDMMMPEMDGFQLIQHLKSDPELSRIAIIVLTSREEMRDLVEMTEVRHFIVKPFDKDAVLNTVRGIFEKTSSPTRPATSSREKSAPEKGAPAPEKGKKSKKDKGTGFSSSLPLHQRIEKILQDEE